MTETTDEPKTLSDYAIANCDVCGETMENPAIWLSYHPYDDPVQLCSVQCHVEKIWEDVR